MNSQRFLLFIGQRVWLHQRNGNLLKCSCLLSIAQNRQNVLCMCCTNVHIPLAEISTSNLDGAVQPNWRVKGKVSNILGFWRRNGDFFLLPCWFMWRREQSLNSKSKLTLWQLDSSFPFSFNIGWCLIAATSEWDHQHVLLIELLLELRCFFHHCIKTHSTSCEPLHLASSHSLALYTLFLSRFVFLPCGPPLFCLANLFALYSYLFFPSVILWIMFCPHEDNSCILSLYKRLLLKRPPS